jgi:hypothetical protein
MLPPKIQLRLLQHCQTVQRSNAAIIKQGVTQLQQLQEQEVPPSVPQAAKHLQLPSNAQMQALLGGSMLQSGVKLVRLSLSVSASAR